ncbi:hypothetical protein [Circoviridae sp.]|nr:hypothetical protein [Circoviridae sp.]UOF79806.1 hypothetical protein [Circoviridae sp.]
MSTSRSRRIIPSGSSLIVRPSSQAKSSRWCSQMQAAVARPPPLTRRLPPTWRTVASSIGSSIRSTTPTHSWGVVV